jgi:hypothetical protein
LVILAMFMFVVRLPDGLQITGTFVLGILPAVVGAAVLWSGFRSGSKSQDPEAERLAGVKEQIVWKAVAQDGRITPAEAAAHAGLPPMEVELALMSLVAEGRAAVEPGESGEIVYRIVSPLGGAGVA